MERTLRDSTKIKSIAGEIERQQSKSAMKARIVRPVIKHQFSQKELLLDALVTEVT
jgi:hypothetical protein